MIKQIPNIITSLNLLSGCVAVLFAVTGDLIVAAVFVFMGIFFDFFDGLAARLLNAQSEVGKQFDSLADLITSGLVPGIVMMQLMTEASSGVGLEYFGGSTTEVAWNASKASLFPLTGLLIVLGSAYRLAKFNVDKRQSDHFIGLPTPANALLILSLPLILEFQYSAWVESIILNAWVLLAITILSCVLLNAEINLFALKFRSWGFKENAKRYIFLLLSVVILFFLKFAGIPVILGLYLLMSLFWRDKNISEVT
ncbi:MAG: phosphatidylserine synthase [Flavobacteriaceae bacterium]|nr:phosphatidylserine synthase [Flavobacteriaceae bacterium]